ncbi:polycomb group RING finger protein 3-like isoform X1 [Crassostrea angulata]|uniref:polycomb group RING finger protein 3-like isoform X1 n=1 Tax=Magallana angulata TaxID=2784310 RepID=UPI0022B1508E|nr:polycomb group RING finger protein 3-like isoform X1 [Crassostrea angulata]
MDASREVEELSNETEKINLSSESVSKPEIASEPASLLEQLKLLPEPPSLSKEPIVLQLRELNPYITCALCGGYLYEASTITECMHTFCKTCIVRYTERSLTCPTCDTPIHPTDPFVHIRHDSTLQDIVYRLLPKVAEVEQKREIEFYENHEKETGEVILPKLQLPPSPPRTPPPRMDQPLLPSEYIRKKKKEPVLGNFRSLFVSLVLTQISEHEDLDEEFELEKQYIRVTKRATIGNVKSFIKKKLQLENYFTVNIFHPEEISSMGSINEDTTLESVRDNYYAGQDCLIELHYKVDPKEEEILKEEELT